MKPTFVRVAPVLLTLTFGLARPALSQVIPVRTVPVASGDQFLTLPSATLGMGGVTLAVSDSLADPWSNPAKGVFIDGPAFLSSPTLYSISDGGGTGRTFPVAGLFKGNTWFGGVSLALQQIENNRGDRFFIEPWLWDGGGPRLSESSARNLFAQGFVGTRLGRSPWSLGVGGSVAGLSAVDGVDLLYANAEEIDQSGTVGDLRVGLYREGSRDRLSLLLVRDYVSVTHDVTYVDVTWDEPDFIPVVERRVEVNEDRTRTWAFEAAYDRDLQAPGWRLGTSATVNRKSHPKIPNYDIQNIPRDPGTTWAFDAGLGLSRTRGDTRFAVDVVLQPIWSETWQEADEEVRTADGKLIRVGEKTIENEFAFTNVVLRTGLSHRVRGAEIQAGLEVRSYEYELDQRNHLEGSFRDQRESWMEWTPSAGVSFRVSDVDVRYAGRLTTGTGQPGVALTATAEAARDALTDFIVAPQGPLTLQEATVMTHQISISVPIR